MLQESDGFAAIRRMVPEPHAGCHDGGFVGRAGRSSSPFGFPQVDEVHDSGVRA